MEYILVALTVLFGAVLTFFSGFGLGTLMLPVFSLFFPIPLAIGATAIVHFANNIFKFSMLYRHIHFPTLFRFGAPALISAILGSLLLGELGAINMTFQYTIGAVLCEITPIKLIIGCLMIFFAWFDLDPRLSEWKVEKKWLPFGGFLSGFFGGISGHQGAFRSAFLTKSGLNKEQFLGTSNAISLLIDFSRITVYSSTVKLSALTEISDILILGITCACCGTYFGKKLVQKTTLKGLKMIVGGCLLIMGILLLMGIL
jgi:uncharacterized membrane protein YfcA